MGAHPQSNDWVVVPELPDLFQWMERKILTMEKLRAKLKKNSGFTLVEMLIVVAIIAILVAVSVPMILSNLEKVRQATDEANMRSAQGVAYAYYLTESSNPDSTVTFEDNGTEFAYRVDDSSHKGEIVPMTTNVQAGASGFKYGQSEDNQKGYVKVTITSNGDVSGEWETPTT